MDKSDNPRTSDRQPSEQNLADREKHNPFQYDTGKSEEEITNDEEAQLEQERKEALTERD